MNTLIVMKKRKSEHTDEKQGVAGLPKESGKRSRKNDRLVTMAILPSLPSMLSLGHNGFLRLQALTLSTNNEY